MADEDKTEEPTGKKLQEAKDEGQIGRSADLNSAVLLLVGFWAMAVFGGQFVQACMQMMVDFFTGYGNFSGQLGDFSAISTVGVRMLAEMLWPILLALLAVGLVVNVAQVGLNFTMKPLEPKLSNVFSLAGLKQIFSMQALVEFAKGVAKMTIIGWVTWDLIDERKDDLLMLTDMDMAGFVAVIIDVLSSLIIRIFWLLLIVGLVDLFYQKKRTHNQLKMSKHEVKDEMKNTTGDPKVIGARKQAMMKMHQKMMAQEVPKATVVITNPTHLAIALRYERGKDQVPVVVAKGKDRMAQRIRELATEHGVPLVENKPLARAMFDHVDIGFPIPQDFFASVAEVMAYVFSLKNPRRMDAA